MYDAFKNVNKNVTIMTAQTDSARVLANEDIVKQTETITDTKYLYIVNKNIAGTTENNTYNFVR